MLQSILKIIRYKSVEDKRLSILSGILPFLFRQQKRYLSAYLFLRYEMTNYTHALIWLTVYLESSVIWIIDRANFNIKETQRFLFTYITQLLKNGWYHWNWGKNCLLQDLQTEKELENQVVQLGKKVHWRWTYS